MVIMITRLRLKIDADEGLMVETSMVWSLDEMGIKDDLLRWIYNHGFEKPSPIQQRSVLMIIKGCVVIAQAPSGTGKTSKVALTEDDYGKGFLVQPVNVGVDAELEEEIEEEDLDDAEELDDDIDGHKIQAHMSFQAPWLQLNVPVYSSSGNSPFQASCMYYMQESNINQVACIRSLGKQIGLTKLMKGPGIRMYMVG